MWGRYIFQGFGRSVPRRRHSVLRILTALCVWAIACFLFEVICGCMSDANDTVVCFLDEQGIAVD